MKQRAIFFSTLLAAAVAVAVPPWLAWREAAEQAYRTESDMALGYANDIVRRADDTTRQALAGIALLERSGHPPCSDAAQALMRRIDLTSIYIQAISHVRDGVLDCSSLGDDPASLGKEAFRASTGVTLYTRIPLSDDLKSPLIGFQRGDFAALIHRDLPLDTWTAVPDVSLAILHTELSRDGRPVSNRGHIDRPGLPGWGSTASSRSWRTATSSHWRARAAFPWWPSPPCPLPTWSTALASWPAGWCPPG